MGYLKINGLGDTDLTNQAMIQRAWAEKQGWNITPAQSPTARYRQDTPLEALARNAQANKASPELQALILAEQKRQAFQPQSVDILSNPGYYGTGRPYLDPLGIERQRSVPAGGSQASGPFSMFGNVLLAPFRAAGDIFRGVVFDAPVTIGEAATGSPGSAAGAFWGTIPGQTTRAVSRAFGGKETDPAGRGMTLSQERRDDQALAASATSRRVAEMAARRETMLAQAAQRARAEAIGRQNAEAAKARQIQQRKEQEQAIRLEQARQQAFNDQMANARYRVGQTTTLDQDARARIDARNASINAELAKQRKLERIATNNIRMNEFAIQQRASQQRIEEADRAAKEREAQGSIFQQISQQNQSMQQAAAQTTQSAWRGLPTQTLDFAAMQANIKRRASGRGATAGPGPAQRYGSG